MKRLLTVKAIIVLLLAFQKEVKSQSNNLKNKKMEPKTEKSAIEKLISSYQEALNVSDTGKKLRGIYIIKPNSPLAILTL